MLCLPFHNFCFDKIKQMQNTLTTQWKVPVKLNGILQTKLSYFFAFIAVSFQCLPTVGLFQTTLLVLDEYGPSSL